MHPDIQSLYSGNIINTEQGIQFLLIQREPGWRKDGIPYVKVEIGEETEEREPHTINWASQRWLVTILNGNQAGLTTHRYIHYFHSINAYLRSNYDLYGEEE